MKIPARQLRLAFLLVALPATSYGGWLFGAETYHECLLDKLTAVVDDQAAVLASAECLKAFPDMRLPKRSASFWFAPQDSQECVAKKAEGHPSSMASRLIREACYLMYPPRQTDE